MSVLRCAYGTRVSATREGAERIDESCELRVSWSRSFYFRFHNVPIIPTFGSARGATGTARAAGRAAAAGTGVGHPTDQQIGSAVIAQFSCKILPFFPRALRLAAARP
jgi:hypothetical protein